MNIAFFDFDGTITTKDSLIGFIRFCVGDVKFLAGLALLSPMLLQYVFKRIPNYQAKEKMLSYFFKGMEKYAFQSMAHQYATKQIEPILRPEALNAIRWHQLQGNKVVIVSASLECWIKPWCEQHSLELLATQLEFTEGIATGKLLTPNCYGEEKAIRIKANYNLNLFEKIYAYGDTRGDKEMLDLAHKKYYRSFELETFQ